MYLFVPTQIREDLEKLEDLEVVWRRRRRSNNAAAAAFFLVNKVFLIGYRRYT